MECYHDDGVAADQGLVGNINRNMSEWALRTVMCEIEALSSTFHGKDLTDGMQKEETCGEVLNEGLLKVINHAVGFIL